MKTRKVPGGVEVSMSLVDIVDMVGSSLTAMLPEPVEFVLIVTTPGGSAYASNMGGPLPVLDALRKLTAKLEETEGKGTIYKEVDLESGETRNRKPPQ